MLVQFVDHPFKFVDDGIELATRLSKLLLGRKKCDRVITPIRAGVGLFGSGWVGLSRDESGKLLITQGSNAGNPITSGLTPLLTFDVWEHAYYLDWQNRRADALAALWDIVDWDVVEGRYE